MKPLTICIFILQASYAFAQFKTNTISNINTTENKMTAKIELIQIGSGASKLMSPSVAQSKQFKAADVRFDTYKVEFQNETTNAGGFYEYLSRVAVTILEDTHTKRVCIFFGRGDFYCSDDSGVMQFEIFPGGIQYQKSCIEISDSTDGLNSAISQFKKNVGNGILNEEKYDSLTTKINLVRFTPAFFFSDSPNPGGAMVMPLIDSYNVTDGVLELALKNPMTKKVAIVSIDIKAKKVIKSIVNGQEMDINVNTRKPFASPLK